MKKIISTLILILFIQSAWSQATYYWVGGTNQSSFTSGSNWNTALDGSGTSRSTANNMDVLIIDGSNIGGTTPSTGAITAAIGAATFGRLILQNGADLAFTRTTSGTSTITIGDHPDGHDLVVFSGCTLRLKGTVGNIVIVPNNNAGSSNNPPATTSATFMIYGTVVMEEGTSGSVGNNRFTSRFKGAMTFASGSKLITQTAYGFYPFGTSGSSTTPINGGVVFEAGSEFYYNGGLSPFGSNSISNFTNFMPGSKLYFRATPGTNFFSNKTFGDVVIENNTTVTADGSISRIDTLRIESGSTFITHVSGTTPIMGNLVNNGTFRVPLADPDRNNRLLMAGTAPQFIGGTGTYTLADFVVSNESTVTLQKSIQADSSAVVMGTLLTGSNSVNGAALNIKSPASYNITGNLNTDSIIIKNISDLTNVEVGMSVSGTGIQPNTVIVNYSSTGTITLSKPVTGSVTYGGTAQSLTIYNGQGVLPVKFGAISGSYYESKVRLEWNILTEINIASYVIERSANGNDFSAIGNVKAANKKTYQFTDAQPNAGINYYRIKAIATDGEVTYSSVIVIATKKSIPEFAINPNPVKGRTMNVAVSGLSRSNYTLVVLNANGQSVYVKDLGILQESGTISIQLPAIVSAGIYNVILKGTDLQLRKAIIIQ